jgi:hypothetical protein
MRAKSKWIVSAGVLIVLAVAAGWMQREHIRYRLPEMSEHLQAHEKAAAGASVITTQTNMYFTQVFSRSGVTVVGRVPDGEALIGKRQEEIAGLYPEEEGYTVLFDGITLQISQTLDDWTPQDKLKYRLKVYQGQLAVYQGPDAQHDALVRVTDIRFDRLPQDVQDQITKGAYEFATPEALNDVLENMDEFS